MKNILLLLLFTPILTGCAAPPASATPPPAPTTAVEHSPTPWPLDATVPRTPTPDPNLLSFDKPEAGTVALDFITSMCNANWTNNGAHIACPGDPNDTTDGYIGLFEDQAVLDGRTLDQPALLTIPAHSDRLGIFGQYPPFTVQYGDEFRTFISCADGSECDVTFHLEYVDAQGGYHTMQQGFGIDSLASISGLRPPGIPIQLSLDSLAGLTVELLLVVREHGESNGAQAVWVAPHIYRDPDYTPPTITPTPTRSSAEETEQAAIPGVIAGWVDMRTAPPYLNDPMVHGGLGAPVVVVVFNLDEGTWRWIHTTATHPAFQITVPPGRYHVAAYGFGVGGMPYVAGGYTGSNPSCGLEMAVVEVPPNGMVEGIVIADWNWTCGGTAYRPGKPDAVPLP